MAALSDGLLIATILLYAVAMLAYAAEYSFGRREAEVAARSQVLVGPAGPPMDSEVVASRSPHSLPQWAGRAAVALTVVGMLTHVGVLAARAAAAHRVPWGNMYEFAVSVCLIAIVGWLVVLTRKDGVRHLGVFVMVPVVLLLGLAGTVLYTQVAPLVPALNSYWLKIHVSAAVIASGTFLVAGALGIGYLARDRFERTARPVFAERLPAAEVLERLTFRVIAFAFPIWTFAIIAGAIWAEAAWSRYWGWDPKETWAFISWVVYAAYLHARSTTGWRGRRAVWISVLGFATMMVNLFGVNLVITGLHSYAGLQ
jgi:cytochrome c-type biogenesis protein CcsB